MSRNNLGHILSDDRILTPDSSEGQPSHRSTPLSRRGTDTPESDGTFASQTSSARGSIAGGSDQSYGRSSNPNKLPSPHPFVDSLTRRLELSAVQSAELHGMVGVRRSNGVSSFSSN